MNPTGTAKSSLKLTSQSSGVPLLTDGDYFGSALSAVGDFDGDGVTDLAVGANGDDTGGDSRGAVYLLFLRTNGSVKATRKFDSATSARRPWRMAIHSGALCLRSAISTATASPIWALARPSIPQRELTEGPPICSS